MTRRRKWSWRRQIAFLNTTTTLAAWRWRQQWFLLLITGLGIIAAIVLSSSLPLFSDVMNTAGLRNVLRAQPDSAQIIASNKVSGISSSITTLTQALVSSIFNQDMGTYLARSPQVEIDTGIWSIDDSISGFTMQLYGAPLQTSHGHLQLLQGRMPVANSSGIEILLTKTAAEYIGNVKVGDSLAIAASLFNAPQAWGGPNLKIYTQTVKVHVVGIFQVQADDPYWDGFNFEAPKPTSFAPEPPFFALTSSSILLNVLDHIASRHQADGVFFTATTPCLIYLSYELDTANIVNTNLGDLISRLGYVQTDIQQQFNQGFNPSKYLTTNAPSNYITTTDLIGSTLQTPANASTLEKFRDQEALAQTPALMLAAQITCLILFFISVMAGALVERQYADIAVMRSRGASRSQVLGSLITQGLGLCLLAGLLGPLLAIGLVRLVAPLFLTSGNQDSINALTKNLWLTLQGVEKYNLIAIVATLATMIFSLYMAVRANIVTQRREEARSSGRPLWQRLRLDLVIAVIALAGYGVAFYVEDTSSLLAAQAQGLVSTPLELLAPLLLIIAAILFFLRLFPYLLGLFARRAQRRRGISSMLALAQMERSPRQPMRMALLLGLATAFAIFSLVFAASQGQRALDISAYQAGSDFSGYLNQLSGDSSATVLPSTTAYYHQIKGVTSTTVGYVDTAYIFVNGADGERLAQETQLKAVDANTFAQTALWSGQDSSQPLGALMAQLINARQRALAQGLVPAIVTTNTAQLLNLQIGTNFRLNDNLGNPDNVTYTTIAEVAHIPPADDTTQAALLVDYQTLAAAKEHESQPIQPNYLWLHSTDNATDVASIHQALTADPAFELTDLLDRRAISSVNASDPLSLNLVTIMSVGVAATLLLAFLANILLPLLSVRSRLTNFAVLRALGTEPGQVTSILTWEQGIILATAVFLGLIFGALLAFTAVQPLVFTGVTASSETSVSSTFVYGLQKIVPIAIVIPPSLAIALAVLIAICLLALNMMTRLAQRPLMSQVLRINED